MEIFDNAITRVYKAVPVLHVPVNLIVMVEEDGTSKFKSLETVLVERQDNELVDIFNSLLESNKRLDIEWFVYSFIKTQTYDEENVDTLIETLNEFFEQSNSRYVGFLKDKDAMDDFMRLRGETVEKRLRTSMQIYREIDTVQSSLLNALQGEKRMIRGPLSTDSADILFKPTLNGTPVTAIDGYKVFNTSTVSYHVPFIQYINGEGTSFFKVFRGITTVENSDLTNLTMAFDERPRPDFILLTLWLGDPEEDDKTSIFTSPRESFRQVVYDLKENRLVISTPYRVKGVSSRDMAVRRVSRALNTLDIGEGEEVRIKASTFLIPFYGVEDGKRVIPELQFDIVEYVFYWLLLVKEAFFRTIYAEESTKPTYLKRGLKHHLHYRPMYTDLNEAHETTTKSYVSNSASVVFTLEVLSSEKMLQLPSLEGSVDLPPGFNFININILKAESQEEIEQFMNVIEALLIIYFWTFILEDTGVKDAYDELVPSNLQLPELRTRMRSKNVQRKLKLEKVKKVSLASLRPDVFGLKYREVCPSTRQPVIGETVEEVESITTPEFKNKKEEGRRSIMQYPSGDNPQFYFSCPNDNSPHPGVVENDTGFNATEHPYLPCCFSTNQTTSRSNVYAKYYKGIDYEHDTSAVITTHKMLKLGRVGILPHLIDSVLKVYTEGKHVMYRMGVQASPNSFLHAVLLAINSPSYLSLVGNESREKYVRELRTYMGLNTRVELLAQELYDKDETSIRLDLNDGNVFFDPSLYFRAVEELFNINVFVFTADSGSMEEGRIEVPRCQAFHARPARMNRASVLIYKYKRLSRVQCDLIIERAPSYDIRVFDDEMTDTCMNVLRRFSKTITWTYPSMKAFEDMYSVVDFQSVFGNSLISQYIDTNGKARAFTFRYLNVDVTVAVPPSQPCNVTYSDKFNFTLPGHAVSLFGSPSAAVHLEGKLVGLWFRLIDVEHFLYVRVDSNLYHSSELDRLPEGPQDPMLAGTRSEIARIRGLKKTLNVIVQLVRWLFILFREEMFEAGTTSDLVARFSSRYIAFDEEGDKVDSLKYYDFSTLDNVLPRVASTDEGVEWLRMRTRGFVTVDNRLVMYSRDFSDKIVGDLARFYKSIFSLYVDIPNRIDGFYTTREDFINVPGVEIIVGRDSFIKWKSSINDKRNSITIRNVLSHQFSTLTDPYLYTDSEGEIYLIQNPISGKMADAAEISTQWNEKRTNPGSHTSALEKRQVYMLYGIAPSGKLTLLENRSNNEKTVPLLITYATKDEWDSKSQNVRYGALLQLI